MINREVIANNCYGDPTMVTELTHLFMNELPGHQQKIERAVKNRSAQEIAFAAHKLRGGLALFGAQEALEVAAKLEQFGNRGEVSQAAQTLPFLSTELVCVAQDLIELLEDEVETAVRG